jgi:REP element-mobilizing transposase RayT
MARPLRIEIAGALYHVTSRGNARQPIFLDDDDRRLFLHRLGQVVQAHRWRCPAYCLMTNHYHLLVETPRADLSRGMQRLNASYAQGFNTRHERVGHVLQGRFTAVLVEQDGHQLELARYVVLNPVRAGMVATPEEYPWSSLRATLGLDPVPAWLESASVLAGFGSRARYLEFVHAGIGRDSPWSGLRGPTLGSEEFLRSLARRVESGAPEVPRRQRCASRPPIDVLLPRSIRSNRRLRDERIREILRSADFSAAEIGRHLGLHYSTISKIASAPPRGRRSVPTATD